MPPSCSPSGRAQASDDPTLWAADSTTSRCRRTPPLPGGRPRSAAACVRRRCRPSRGGQAGPRPARALGRQHAGVQREAAGSRAGQPADPPAIPTVGRTGGLVSTRRRAPCSCRTSRRRLCTSSSMRSRPKSSPAIPRSTASCCRERSHRGFTRTANGGPGGRRLRRAGRRAERPGATRNATTSLSQLMAQPPITARPALTTGFSRLSGGFLCCPGGPGFRCIFPHAAHLGSRLPRHASSIRVGPACMPAS